MIVLQENNINEVMKLINEFAWKNIIFQSRVEWEPGVYSHTNRNLVSSNLCNKRKKGLSINFHNNDSSFWDFGSRFEFNEEHKFFIVKNNLWYTKLFTQYSNPVEYCFGYYDPTI